MDNLMSLPFKRHWLSMAMFNCQGYLLWMGSTVVKSGIRTNRRKKKTPMIEMSTTRPNRSLHWFKGNNCCRNLPVSKPCFHYRPGSPKIESGLVLGWTPIKISGIY
jgi:hypothetical protein